MVIPALLTLFMLWKTKAVDETYSETKPILTLILIHLQLLLISIPLLFLTADRSLEGKYVVQSFVFFTFSVSTVLLSVGPCVYRLYFIVASSSIRGSMGSGEVRVTYGLSSDGTSGKRVTNISGATASGTEREDA